MKFRNSKDCFQTNMKSDMARIRASSNVLVFADKRSNIYEVLQDYKKLLKENITKSYKMSTNR